MRQISALRIVSSILVVALAIAFSAFFDSCSGGGGGGGSSTALAKVTQPGTQPTEAGTFQDVSVCQNCHQFSDGPNNTIQDGIDESPYDTWKGTMMANAARDPLFWALLAVENKALASKGVAIGDFCLRCHAPKAWLEGRSDPADGSALQGEDFNSVPCDVCHRMADPLSVEGMGLTTGPSVSFYGNAQFVVAPVVTPKDVKRGPYDIATPPNAHNTQQSLYYLTSEFCANCHEIRNPYYNNTVSIEKTYTEWKNSAYATEGTQCQTCHMPLVTGFAAIGGGPQRPDIALHRFIGGNAWAPLAIQQFDTSLTTEDKAYLNKTPALAVQQLQSAATLTAVSTGGTLSVTVTNLTGHKLPTGYTEGRRIWLDVQFYNGTSLVSESGAYDESTGVLTEDTELKVYEARPGLQSVDGYADGVSYHFALNNHMFKDNRIPPRGFTNAAFNAAGAPVVGATYADGQNWDTTSYSVPNGATSAVVTLKYQTTTKEFVEFLRDENVGNAYDIKGAGQKLYDIWTNTGRSAPVSMATVTVSL
jgi:Cytochrome c554 and c-prime